MATITPTVTNPNDNNSARPYIIWTWGPMLMGDIGAAPPSNIVATYSDSTYQVDGTFGGASVAILGSLDGSNSHALHNSQGVTIGLTAAGITTVLEAVPASVPSVTGGDGTTSLTVTGFFRRTL